MLAPPPPVTAALEPLDETTLLILEVDLDGLTVTDGLGAYGDPADPLIPMGELTRLLELDVDVMPGERRIVGRIGEARRSLLVDVNSGAVRLGSQSIELRPGDVAVSGADIFLRLSLAGRLLPLKMELVAADQRLHLHATEKLPIQGRLERLARRRQDGGPAPSEASIDVPAPYRLITLPAFDVGLNLGLQTETPEQITGGEVRVASDLFYMDFQGYFATSESGEPQSARVLFERRSARGLFGPLKARTFALGDVYTPALALGPRSLGGRGVFLSTVAAGEENVFHQVDLRGELPLGYDVELYVNDVLRSGQNTPNKGRYEFLNVPLSPGINVIRIVTYGPRGERNEQTRIINLRGGQLERGEANFEFGLVDQEEPLIRLTRPVEGDLALPQANGLRATAVLNYGLTDRLTVSLGGASAPTLTGTRQVVNLGARTSLFGLFTQLDLAQDLGGGQAAALGLAGRFRGFDATVRHSLYLDDFVDEGGPAFSIDRLIASRTELTVDGALSWRGADLPVSFRSQRIAFENGESELNLSARSSTTLRGYYLSGGLEYQRLAAESVTQNLAGFLALSSFRNFRTQIRASLDFDLLPDVSPRALAVTVDHQLNPAVTLRFGVGQNLEDLGSTNFTAGSVFRLRAADLALSGNYNNGDQSWAIGAQLNFGLSYNPALGRYQMGPPGPASSGSVLFHAFMDENGNGRADPGEEPVPDVLVEGGEAQTATGRDGRAMVRNTGAGPTGRLKVSLEKVQDISVSAPPSNINISPRPGGLSRVDYPIRPTGEVLVNVKLRREDGQTVGLSAVNVRLEGEQGQVFEGATEFDGSAYFESVPIGAYAVTLDPDQAKRLRMNLAAPGKAVVERNAFARAVELEVTFSPPAEPSAG